uniref:Uncharacterized protein n=1 Tax=Parascaris univalens TaxID=6257 RepID=A0A915ASN6_PARUN
MDVCSSVVCRTPFATSGGGTVITLQAWFTESTRNEGLNKHRRGMEILFRRKKGFDFPSNLQCSQPVMQNLWRLWYSISSLKQLWATFYRLFANFSISTGAIGTMPILSMTATRISRFLPGYG